MKEIKLTFHKDGKTVTKEVDGFTGKTCIEATNFIDEAIGTAVKTEHKQEFYAPEPVGADQQNHLYI